MKLFVTGIGTDVGKSVCAAILVKYFKAAYWKPIQAGDLHFSDTMKVKSWLGENVTTFPETYQFTMAASPHHAAANEDLSIDIKLIELPETNDNLIVEGAGGLMVPLSDDECVIDLIKKLDIPVALVVKNYLGCINHTLLSLLAIKNREIPLQYLILNGNFPTDTEKILLKNIDDETKVIRIPSIENISLENIQKQAKNLIIN